MKKKFSSGLTDIIAEHKGQMKKIWMLAVNDLIKKYKGAVMGPLWAIIKPTFTLFILWFAFTIGIRGSGKVSGYPRFIFMLSGYIPWFFISEVIVGGFTFDKTEQSVCYKTFISCVEYYDLLYTCVTDNTRRNVHNNVCDIADSGVRAFDI